MEISLARASNLLSDIFSGTTSATWIANALAEGVDGKSSAFFSRLKKFLGEKELSRASNDARMALMLTDELYEMQTEEKFKKIKGTTHFILQAWELTPAEEQKFWDCMYIFDHVYGFESRWNRDDLLGIMQSEEFPYAVDMDDDMGWNEWLRLVDDYEKKLKRGYFTSRESGLDQRAAEHSNSAMSRSHRVDLGEQGFDY